jgi:xanthine dehydrogenase YagR molybdenum-binding subunit
VADGVVKSIDVSAAEKLPGVTAVRVLAKPGTQIRWAGTELASVAATKETIARDALKLIKVEYEVRPHLVKEQDLKAAAGRAKPAGEQLTGDPDAAFKSAAAVSEGEYGIPVITHCCLETHGNVVGWSGDKIEYYPSTQNVSGVPGDLARSLSVPASQISAHMDYMGGGFGSKFPADLWATECALLSKASGGKPVKMFLDRGPDLTIAGVRPSHFAKIKLAANASGEITAWESNSWSSGGFTGGGMAPLPYVFTNIPNKRLNHIAVALNAGPQRAWRAPNHPQASFLTCSAIEDLAAKLGKDPLDVFKANAKWTPRAAVYLRQLDKAAELAEWSKKWHPRGQAGSGAIKTGLGIGVNTWGGAGHASKCLTTIAPDGSVKIEIGSQDLGTGTRTIINQVAAETLGLQMNQVQVNIGKNAYPASGASGGSTTVGGVSSSTRKSCVNALEKLLEKVAPALGAPAAELEAVDGMIRVKGNPAKSMAWKAACQKLGGSSIAEMGDNDPKNPMGLNTQGVGGVQIAEVAVDTMTGQVMLKKLVAVQDCGLIINPKTAESQVYGACIMSICAALMEERIMDPMTGKVVNADMEFYKLAGLMDIGEIVCHLEIDEVNDKRGVIGLGEPPAVGGIGAIANAVANAIGVRVPMVPLTPYRVLSALYGPRMEKI